MVLCQSVPLEADFAGEQPTLRHLVLWHRMRPSGRSAADLIVRLMTPEQEIAQKKRLVSAAKALLSLQVGIAVGCLRVCKILSWLRLRDDERYKVFSQFIEATGAIPIANERLLWAYEALMEQDEKLATIEAMYRPSILKACIAIITSYQ